MKNKVNILLIISILIIANQLFAQSTSMNVNQFEEKLKSNGTHTQLIDVRTSDEFKKDHLNGAINYDIYEANFESNLNKLDKNKPVFVYCYSGGRSSQAVSIMKKKGFKTIYEMSEGFMKWKASGKAVTK